MAERGRKPGFTMLEEHRGKIIRSAILNALIEHAEGRREMSSTQVQAGLGLLKKVIPDLSATTISGPDGGPIQTEDISARELVTSRVSQLSARIREGENI